MKVKLREELNELSEIFTKKGKKLFIVGGFVRDNLLNLNPTDVDVCSSITNEQLFEMLKNTGFIIKPASKKLGTVIISKNNKKFEHTTFRKESYLKGGNHSPHKVEFVNSLDIDAKRRDFTINAIYYDIENDQIVDPYNAIKDLNKKMVKAVVSPKVVFKSDGLRILRMVRFASELNFKIERKTFNTAKKFVFQLQDISKDRIFNEFMLILNSQNKYGLKNNAVNNLIKLNTLPYIFPNLRALKPNFDYKRLIKGFKLNYFNVENSLQNFMLDLCLHLEIKTHIQANKIATMLLNTKIVGISVKQKNYVIKFIKAYEESFNLNKELDVKLFICNNVEVIKSLLQTLEVNKNSKYELIENNYEYMKNNNIPFSIKDLKIDGNDIVNNFENINKTQIGTLLNKAFIFALKNKNNNTKANLLNYLKEVKL